jgi:hypothetical protein
MSPYKTLTPAEYKHLREFVAEVRELYDNDVEGLLIDLADQLEVAEEILNYNEPTPTDPRRSS